MIVKLLNEHHLGFLSLKRGCRGSSESTLAKMPHCWKSHAMAHMISTKTALTYAISSSISCASLSVVLFPNEYHCQENIKMLRHHDNLILFISVHKSRKRIGRKRSNSSVAPQNSKNNLRSYPNFQGASTVCTNTCYYTAQRNP